MNERGKNILLDVTFDLSIQLIDYCELLEENRKYVISKQLLKSGTAVGANSREAQGAESKIDFIHKLKIAYKEAEEAEYWLELCQMSRHYPSPSKDLKQQLESSKKILGKIISSTKRNLR